MQLEAYVGDACSASAVAIANVLTLRQLKDVFLAVDDFEHPIWTQLSDVAGAKEAVLICTEPMRRRQGILYIE